MPGERGDMDAQLRQDGTHRSLLSSWRPQLGAYGAAGIAATKPDCKPRLTEAERRNVDRSERNAELERKLLAANKLIALPEPAHRVPGSDGLSLCGEHAAPRNASTAAALPSGILRTAVSSALTISARASTYVSQLVELALSFTRRSGTAPT